MNWFTSRKIKKLLKRFDMLGAYDEVVEFLSGAGSFNGIDFVYDPDCGDLILYAEDDMARFTKPNKWRQTWRS
jgi:hypothetical protein